MKIKIIDYGYEKLPNRAHYNDAGADVYACFHDDAKIALIMPGETLKIPLGLGLDLPDGFMACVYPRSGWASKGIVCELPPIDSGYKGEIHAICHNGSSVAQVISKGDRIGQIVITPVILCDFVPKNATNDECERGCDAFGSSGM